MGKEVWAFFRALTSGILVRELLLLLVELLAKGSDKFILQGEHMVVDLDLVVGKLAPIALLLLLGGLSRLEVLPIGTQSVGVNEVEGGSLKLLLRGLLPHVNKNLRQVLSLSPLCSALNLVVEVNGAKRPTSIHQIAVVL